MTGGDAPLVAFDRATARAVVAVLRRAGIAAVSTPLDDDEDEVSVPEAKRGLALAVLSDNMEQIAGAVARGREDVERQPADEDDPYEGPPLVMERFRRMGLVPVLLLIPLLAVTLAAPGLPRWAIWLILGLAVVAVVAGRRVRRR